MIFMLKCKNNKIMNLKSLSELFFCWNIKIYKCKNLKNYYDENKKKSQKLMNSSFNIKKKNIYKEKLMSNFINIKKINIFLKLNESNLNINILIFNGLYLNYNFIKNWCFSNKIQSISYFVFFIKRILSIMFNIMFSLIIKMLFLIKKSVEISLKKNV
jgi:hypothetical protein